MPQPHAGELTRLLVSASPARGEREARIRELAGLVDYEHWEAFLKGQRLLALCGSRLAGIVPLPEPLAGSVDQALLTNRKAALAIEAVAQEALGALHSAAIPAIPLKGPVLAQRIYADAGLRQSTDVDLLVPKPYLAQAVDALRAQGFTEHPRRAVEELHVSLAPGQPSAPQLDLHWRVHWYEDSFSEELVATATRDPDGSWRPEAALDFAALLLFWVRDGLAGLRYPADIAAWWDRYGDTLERGDLAAVAERHSRLRSALFVPAMAAEAAVAVPAASWALAGCAPRRRDHLAGRLANWSLQGDAQQVAADRSVIDMLVSPPGARAAIARRTLARSAAGATPPILGPLGQWAKLASRWLVALFGIRRGRSRAG